MRKMMLSVLGLIGGLMLLAQPAAANAPTSLAQPIGEAALFPAGPSGGGYPYVEVRQIDPLGAEAAVYTPGGLVSHRCPESYAAVVEFPGTQPVDGLPLTARVVSVGTPSGLTDIPVTESGLRLLFPVGTSTVRVAFSCHPR